MNISEDVVRFDCQGDGLIGVASMPAEPRDVGVVIVVGGPQYRAGSHRQFVQLARRLAGAGFATLRFDHRGMGDSDGAPRGFEQVGEDIGCAVSALIEHVPGLRRVVLWGLCDGASASLLYLHAQGPDPRVAGLCLVNPWVRSAQTLAASQVQHYYRQRLMQREFWIKLLRGGLAWRSVGELAGKLALMLHGRSGVPQAGPDATFQRRMAAALAGFEGPTLLVLSGKDMTSAEFAHALKTEPDWREVIEGAGVEKLELPQADHTFSAEVERVAMQEGLLRWLGGLVVRGTVAVVPASGLQLAGVVHE